MAVVGGAIAALRSTIGGASKLEVRRRETRAEDVKRPAEKKIVCKNFRPFKKENTNFPRIR